MNMNGFSQSAYSADRANVESLRIEEINQSILFSGDLFMRNLYSDDINVNSMMMFKDSYWSRRFAVIRTGLLLLYEHRTDVYDEDKDAIDEIGLANILVIESSTDDLLDFSSTHEIGEDGLNSMTAPSIDCLFDVQARVQFGGDSQGIRVFSFYSDSESNAVHWMDNLCKAVGFLELVPAAGGGYVSVVSEAAIIERRGLQLRRQVAMMREGAGGDSIRRLASCPALAEAGHGHGSTPPGRGRGRGRGRAFRGLTMPSKKHLNEHHSPGKNGTLNRLFHSEPDELEYLAYERQVDEGSDQKKEKYMADVHRNHFKEVGLTGGGAGRGFGGRGRGGRGSFVVASGRSQAEHSTRDDYEVKSAFKENRDAQEQDDDQDDCASSSCSMETKHQAPPIAVRGREGGRGRGRGRSGARGIIESSCPF